MSMCSIVSCFVGRGCLLWPVRSLGKTLLAFSLLHFVLQDQTCLLFWVSLDSLLLHSNPLWWKEHFSSFSSRRSCRSSSVQFSSVQLLSRVRLFATPWTAARQASLSITNSRSSLKTHVHWVGDATQPSRPLSSPSPPAPNPSQHQSLFQWVNSSHEVTKVLEFQL